jgi:hypothetical protein
MIEQGPLVPHRWDIETDVVVARLGTAGLPSPLMHQAKEQRSYEKYMAR